MIPLQKALNLGLQLGDLLSDVEPGANQFPIVTCRLIGYPNRRQLVAGQHMRPHDLVCVGVYLADDRRMIAKDVALFNRYCAAPPQS